MTQKIKKTKFQNKICQGSLKGKFFYFNENETEKRMNVYNKIADRFLHLI